MIAIRYTKEVAAIHELGHAIVAATLNLEFSSVAIWPHDKCDWAGKCYLAEFDDPSRDALISSFNMAGPLAQLAYAPESLGEHLHFFHPSLFTSSQTLKAEYKPLIDLFWAGDFSKSMFLHHASDILAGNKSEMPYLFELENQLRLFFLQPVVRDLCNKLVGFLTQHEQLSAEVVKNMLRDEVPQALLVSLRTFVRNIPPREPFDYFSPVE